MDKDAAGLPETPETGLRHGPLKPSKLNVDSPGWLTCCRRGGPGEFEVAGVANHPRLGLNFGPWTLAKMISKALAAHLLQAWRPS